MMMPFMCGLCNRMLDRHQFRYENDTPAWSMCPTGQWSAIDPGNLIVWYPSTKKGVESETINLDVYWPDDDDGEAPLLYWLEDSV